MGDGEALNPFACWPSPAPRLRTSHSPCSSRGLRAGPLVPPCKRLEGQSRTPGSFNAAHRDNPNAKRRSTTLSDRGGALPLHLAISQHAWTWLPRRPEAVSGDRSSAACGFLRIAFSTRTDPEPKVKRASFPVVSQFEFRERSGHPEHVGRGRPARCSGLVDRAFAFRCHRPPRSRRG